jgi:hypothetical protein
VKLQYFVCSSFRGRLYKIEGFNAMGYWQAEAAAERLRNWLSDRELEIEVEVGAWEECD